MAKERNKYEQESNALLQKLPSIECEVIRTAPYFKDGRTKATSYLLTALDKQSTRKDGKKISIIEFYQAMLPVCLEIAKNDIEQKESAEREKRAKEGIN